LISLVVYDSPELSRNFRIDEEGGLRLPMLRQHIEVAGLTMDECENAIAAALVNEQVLVNPIVSVSVAEFHSRPITVVGAVRTPSTFQASSSMTLLDAITRAGGIGDNAGPEILITHQASSEKPGSVGLVERIPAKSLQDPTSNSANIELQGGDIVRVPVAGQIYMVGNVKHPGPFFITNTTDMTMMKALSIAGGLDSYASHTAYIYRADKDDQRKSEIPIKLSKILARKSPDVPLYADDMVYIPNRGVASASMKTLEVAGAALGIASFFVYTVH
jgi:polysaccharide export outer membrane protein